MCLISCKVIKLDVQRPIFAASVTIEAVNAMIYESLDTVQ